MTADHGATLAKLNPTAAPVAEPEPVAAAVTAIDAFMHVARLSCSTAVAAADVPPPVVAATPSAAAALWVPPVTLAATTEPIVATSRAPFTWMVTVLLAFAGAEATTATAPTAAAVVTVPAAPAAVALALVLVSTASNPVNDTVAFQPADEVAVAVTPSTVADAVPLLRRSLFRATAIVTLSTVTTRGAPEATPPPTPLMATKPPSMPHPRSSTVDPGPHCSVTFTSRSDLHPEPSSTTVFPAPIETFCDDPAVHCAQSVLLLPTAVLVSAAIAKTTAAGKCTVVDMAATITTNMTTATRRRNIANGITREDGL